MTLIDRILLNLKHTINKQRQLTLDDNKITVRMGREIVQMIGAYNKSVIMNYSEPANKKTIFGYPLEVDVVNPMCLEVNIVEKVCMLEREADNE